MDEEYKESSGHLPPAPVQHPPIVAEPYYQHQYHHHHQQQQQHRPHQYQYQYPHFGPTPPAAGLYEANNDGEEVQGGDTEAKPPKKPPQPPKSAFVLFSDYKHEEREKNGEAICKKEAIAVVADAWRSLSESERHYWMEQERNDKLRYVKEKEDHQGPWEQPKRRAKKHPLAPKRPMSAFLKYSKTRRREVKDENPDMSNTDISRLLGEMWRNASPEERRPYREQEEKERAVYKAEIAKWRADQARLEQERALSMPSTSSASSTNTESRPSGSDDTAHHYHQHQQPPEYDAKVSHVPYEYAKRTNPLNHHDPNGSHFNEPSASATSTTQYNDSTRRGDGYDYSYTHHRPDYRQQHYLHDQYRHQVHHSGSDTAANSYGNSGPNEGGEGYSDFRHNNYYDPSSSHHSRPSQEGGGHYTYTYDSGTSALLAAAASDSVDQHDGQSDKDEAQGPYYYPYSAATEPNGEANHRVDDQQSTEGLNGGDNGGTSNDGDGNDNDAATVQYSYDGHEQQGSSLTTAASSDDPDMPPPLPPPQVELPSSSPRRGFFVSL